MVSIKNLLFHDIALGEIKTLISLKKKVFNTYPLTVNKKFLFIIKKG